MNATPRSRSNSADHSTVTQAQIQLQRTAKALEGMAIELALAKQVKEYDGNRQKRILAIAMKIYLDQGESAAAAECKGRAGDYYFNAMTELAGEYKSALEVIEKYEAQRVLWESARSLLSVEKAKINLL